MIWLLVIPSIDSIIGEADGLLPFRYHPVRITSCPLEDMTVVFVKLPIFLLRGQWILNYSTASHITSIPIKQIPLTSKTMSLYSANPTFPQTYS